MIDLQTLNFIYIVLSITAIVILVYLYVNKCREPFCACRHEGDKRCPDPKVLTDLYNSGKLTEYTDFAKISRGAPEKMIMPEDRFAKQNYGKDPMVNPDDYYYFSK